MKNKKSADIINLEFQHLCLDNAKKSRFAELSQKEKFFKRKYSWCLSKDKNKDRTAKLSNNMDPKSALGKSVLTKSHSFTISHSTKRDNSARSIPKTPSITISRCSDQSTSSVSSESSLLSRRNSKTPYINIPRCNTESTRQSLSPSSFSSSPGSIDSLESRFSPEVLLRRRKSSEELVVRRRTSIHEMDSEGRVSYLDRLWSNVFRTEKEIPRKSYRQTGRPKTPLRESFNKIVLGQFNETTAQSSTPSTPRLPNITNKGSPQVRDRPDSGNISTESKIIHQEKIEILSVEENTSKEEDVKEDSITKDAEQETAKDPTTAPNSPRSENEGNADSAKDSHDDDKSEMLKQMQAKSIERRRSSLNNPLNKPPFMTFSMRERSLSVDHEISRNLWRTGLLSLQTSQRRGRQKLISCMKLAVSKDRDMTLKGKRWRDDLKRCRYLRIPEDSPYMRPDTSDSESD